MQLYKIQIQKQAISDIQQAIIWYNDQLKGLGKRFHIQVKSQIDLLESNAHHYGIRYADVRCVLVKKFPFLIHFTIDELSKTVNVFAVIHTSRNPTIWSEMKNR